ncbi:MAG: hypothetical protein SPD81_10945 [Candidatus Faecousia sp.]|nr:hypothetical protein [Candidatus Faecousia sp.]
MTCAIVYNTHKWIMESVGMMEQIYQEILDRSLEPSAQSLTVEYLAQNLNSFLKRGERVLICFPEHEEGSLSWLMEKAVLRCGAVPVVWGKDYRWKTLLRMAFFTKSSVFIGAPLIALGLMKLQKTYSIPLYIRKVITGGYPCLDWMADGIRQGFDCETGGCFGLGMSGVVAGFSCGHSPGVHIRDSEYGVDIVDDEDRPALPGKAGRIVLYPKQKPLLRYAPGEMAVLDPTPCACGCSAPRLVEISPGDTLDPDLLALGQELQSWNSILDCRLKKGQYGLEIELITFRGEKLPKLPSAARQIIRPWDPDHDEPFWYVPKMEKNTEFSEEGS